MKPLIVGNWKMHKTCSEAKEHVHRLKHLFPHTSVGIWLAVPYTTVQAASDSAKESSILIGAQNMSDLLAGALTGEISALMLIEAGASFVILGHSERRRLFHEDDFMINRKVSLALRTGLKVILCIGETKEQREASETETVLRYQLKECLEGVRAEQMSEITIAYEPVWAIGSKQPATAENVEKIHELCKNLIVNDWKVPQNEIRVIYGGSAVPSNAKEFLELPAVDGLLVGGASLDVQSFAEIIQQAENIQ